MLSIVGTICSNLLEERTIGFGIWQISKLKTDGWERKHVVVGRQKIASLISGQIKVERATPCRKIFNWGGGGLWKTGSQAWTGCNNLHMYEPELPYYFIIIYI